MRLFSDIMLIFLGSQIIAHIKKQDLLLLADSCAITDLRKLLREKDEIINSARKV